MSDNAQRKMIPVSAEESKQRAVLLPNMPGPAIRGNGNLDLFCPHCNYLLVSSLGAIPPMMDDSGKPPVLRCFNCKKDSEFPPDLIPWLAKPYD